MVTPPATTRKPVALVIAVVALTIGLVAGGLAGRLTAEQAPAPKGLASQQVLDMLAGRVVAVNAGDKAAIARYYTADAILEERDQDPAVVTTTNTQIAAHLVDYQSIGFRLYRTGGSAVVLGPFVTEPLTWSGDAGGLVTYQLAADGRIMHQWVTGAPMPTIP